MGQYFYIVNSAKKQYLHPHKLGEGLKLGELGGNCMAALSWLLADNSGDGSWSGDPIVVAGDYGSGLHNTADNEFEDITYRIVKELCEQHPYYVEQFANDLKRFGARHDSDFPADLRAVLWPNNRAEV